MKLLGVLKIKMPSQTPISPKRLFYLLLNAYLPSDDDFSFQKKSNRFFKSLKIGASSQNHKQIENVC